jgi:L-ribulokinase
VYRALIEATAFGARAIVERITEFGIPVERVVNCGGIAEKNDLFMQIYADVLGRPMFIAGSSQAPALGSAMSAAVAAGVAVGGHETFEEAREAMTSLKEKRFLPDPEAQAVYDELFGMYMELHDIFGGVGGAHADLPGLMKRLLSLRARAAGTSVKDPGGPGDPGVN